MPRGQGLGRAASGEAVSPTGLCLPSGGAPDTYANSLLCARDYKPQLLPALNTWQTNPTSDKLRTHGARCEDATAPLIANGSSEPVPIGRRRPWALSVPRNGTPSGRVGEGCPSRTSGWVVSVWRYLALWCRGWERRACGVAVMACLPWSAWSSESARVSVG
jgi:hypothetical protein